MSDTQQTPPPPDTGVNSPEKDTPYDVFFAAQTYRQAKAAREANPQYHTLLTEQLWKRTHAKARRENMRLM